MYAASGRPRVPAGLSVVLNVCKEPGPTSHDVVARVRRMIGEQRVGHAGTLDPAAAGVLVVLVGSATRLVEYYVGHDKVYVAEIVFGVATDTHDVDGTIVGVSERIPDEAAVREALAAFRGEQWQQPPQFAAIKHHGRRLYRRARAGEGLEVAPRRVRIDRLELVRWAPPAAHVLLHCSAGTYVRSLARDLGERLGCGAYVHRLVRVASGPFTLAEARTLDAWEAAFADGTWRALVHAPDRALFACPVLLLDAMGERALGHGQPLAGRAPRADEPRIARAYDVAGRLVGVLRWEEGQGRWQPTKVLR